MEVELTLFGQKATLDLPTYAPMELAIARAFQVWCENDTYKELTIGGHYDKVKVSIVENGPIPQCNELVEKYGFSGLYMANPILEHFENMDEEILRLEVRKYGSTIQARINGLAHEWFECTKKDKLHSYPTGSLVDADDVWYLDELGLGENA
jgi:hypothetical protein|nr:MAG TPA: hypothetical protein [Caudoviricetes sp.]